MSERMTDEEFAIYAESTGLQISHGLLLAEARRAREAEASAAALAQRNFEYGAARDRDLVKTEAERDALTERVAVLELEAAQQGVRIGELEAALLVVSTDIAQDPLEDPVGHFERWERGWAQLGRGAVEVIRAALSPKGREGEHED